MMPLERLETYICLSVGVWFPGTEKTFLEQKGKHTFWGKGGLKMIQEL